MSDHFERLSATTPAAERAPYRVMDGEARFLDVDLGAWLGMERPRKIRELIERHRAEIEAFGLCPAVGQNHEGGRGRPATEYWLNRNQAVLVAVLSRTERAQAVRRQVIEAADRYERERRDFPVAIGPLALGSDDLQQLARMIVIEQGRAHRDALAAALPAAVNRALDERFAGMALTAAGVRSAVVPATVLDDRRLSPRDLAVLATLARSTDLGGWVQISHRELGAQTGLSRSAAQRAVERLVDCGHLERHDAGVTAEEGQVAHSYRIADRTSPGSLTMTRPPAGAEPGSAREDPSESLATFARDCVERTSVDGASTESVTAREMYEAYVSWRLAKGGHPVAEAAFGRAFPKLGFRRVDGRVRRYVDVRLTNVPERPTSASVRAG